MIDLDIRKFYELGPVGPGSQGGSGHCHARAALGRALCEEVAGRPIVMPDGRTEARDKGTPRVWDCSFCNGVTPETEEAPDD